MNDAIDKCVSGGLDSHYSVANALHVLLNHDNVNTYDFSTLTRFCSTQLCSAFMARANYWNTESYRTGCEHQDMFQEYSKILMKIAIHLRNNTYKNLIIKEFNECFASLNT